MRFGEKDIAGKGAIFLQLEVVFYLPGGALLIEADRLHQRRRGILFAFRTNIQLMDYLR